jgi:hypothetical protein
MSWLGADLKTMWHKSYRGNGSCGVAYLRSGDVDTLASLDRGLDCSRIPRVSFFRLICHEVDERGR